MLGITLALVCGLFLALSNLSLRQSFKGLQPSVAFFFDAIFGALIWIPLAMFMGISASVDWKAAFAFALASTILSEVVLFYALSHGELAVTVTILASYPAYTVIFSRLLNKEMLTTPVAVFVFITILGSIITSLPEKFKKTEFRLNQGIMWPFMAAVCIGVSDGISKGYINRSADFSFLFALGVLQLPVALLYLRAERQSLVQSMSGVVRKFQAYKFAVLGGLFNIIGTAFLWLSFSFAPASIASPITGSNGALTVVLARLFLHEKITYRKYLGIILTFVGVMGIAVLRSK